MDQLKKQLEDNFEDLSPADPVEVWTDTITEKLARSGKQGVIKMPSKELHDMYIEWARQLNEPSYLYNQIQFMVRLSRLKIEGVKTGIHTNKCKMCSFDMDIINKISH